MPALRDQVDGAMAEAKHTGWDELLATQRQYLDSFWSRADVEVDGSPRLQQALRFGMYHVLQAGSRAEGRAIPAKGLTGPGYDGHVFWDTETFVLPVLTYTAPHAVADALRWRHATLDQARARAQQLGLRRDGGRQQHEEQAHETSDHSRAVWVSGIRRRWRRASRGTCRDRR